MTENEARAIKVDCKICGKKLRRDNMRDHVKSYHTSFTGRFGSYFLPEIILNLTKPPKTVCLATYAGSCSQRKKCSIITSKRYMLIIMRSAKSVARISSTNEISGNIFESSTSQARNIANQNL